MALHPLKKINKRKSPHEQLLPPIPDKRYFTIGEVGVLCGVKPHVLRYWEQEFSGLKPIKRRGNRRYYQYKDVMMVRKIRQLLYEECFTIEGARTKLTDPAVSAGYALKTDIIVKKIIVDLEGVLEKLKIECLT